MRTVADMLKKKGANTISVEANTPVIEALRVMDEKNIGSLVVLSNGSYLGILTERDYSRKVILKGRNSSETTVDDIMSKDQPTLAPNDTIDRCMELMSDKHLRYLPVFSNGQLAGIVSMSDVVNATISNQKETISHLESYIAGS